MRSFDFTNLAGHLYSSAWAILPEKLAALVAVFEARRRGGSVSLTQADLDQIAADQAADRVVRAGMIHAQMRKVAGFPVDQVGATAILPMYGVITQRPSLFTQFCGGTSAEQFVQAHKQLVADETVKAIVWDIDSPGGSVAGVPEAAAALLAMRGQKKTVAFSNTMMASAAYWLGSAADEVVSAPSAITGSIGVVTVHENTTRATYAKGVDVTYFHAGKYKTEGYPDTPLTAEARGAMQQMIDDFYGQFVGAVAKARQTTAGAVRAGFGEGRALTAGRARAAKLVDRVESLSTLLGRIVSYSTNGGGMAYRQLLQRQAEAELA